MPNKNGLHLMQKEVGGMLAFMRGRRVGDAEALEEIKRIEDSTDFEAFDSMAAALARIGNLQNAEDDEILYGETS